MNTQEAIEQIKQETYYHCGEKECYKDGCKKYVESDIAIDIINQIDEPQKVVIPKFVADFVEANGRKEFYARLDILLYDYYVHQKSSDMTAFISSPQNIKKIILAYEFGYEVEEEEKLYTVEIPNPNAKFSRIILQRFSEDDIRLTKVDNEDWKIHKMNQLKESEIKQDFEWAWQWAEPVEVAK